jgi:hypothetical protein
MTPAQAYGHPNFVTDVPVQGPTDEGMRRLACCWTRTRIPQTPACADCEGPIPMWTRQAITPSVGSFSSGVQGFAESGLGNPYALALARPGTLAGPSDPTLDKGLAVAQLAWVQNALLTLNNKIMSTSGSSCPTWADPTANLAAAVGCFQAWWNTHYAKVSGGAAKMLRTDGGLDEDTLCALQTITSMHPEDFGTPFPDPTKQFCKAPPPLTQPLAAAQHHWGKLSTPVKIGVVTAALAGVGVVVYAVTRPKKESR